MVAQKVVKINEKEFAEKYGIRRFESTEDLKMQLEKLLSTPKYILGYIKYREEIAEIKSVISSLTSDECNGYIYERTSPREMSVFFQTNDELNLYLKILCVEFGELDYIPSSVKKAVANDIFDLGEKKKLEIAYYFLVYLYEAELIELSEEKLEIAYKRLKDFADSDYFLNRDFRRQSFQLKTTLGYNLDYCEYLNKIPLYISIIEYKKNRLEDSTKYLVRMLDVSRNNEKCHESRVISLLTECYLEYEFARRLSKGEGIKKDMELANSLCEKILGKCSSIGKGERHYGYIFENPSKHVVNLEELQCSLGKLRDYTSFHRPTMENKVDDTENIIQTLSQAENNSNEIGTGNRDWKKVDELLEELNDMQGLDSVKRKVNEIVATIKASTYKKEKYGDESTGLGTMHLLFTGNAGTGKTTIARKIGQIYGALGIIKNPDLFVETGRSKLVGQYLGETAKSVQETVESALGGVLFIDEAYSLTDGGGDKFGTEAVNTLIAEVENHRHDLIVILAGYQDKMNEFLDTNQGLRSRFSTEIYFEDYSPTDMVAIIKNFGEKMNPPMHYSKEVESALYDYFVHVVKEKSDFGNARGVRNIFEKMIGSLNSRIAERLGRDEEPTLEESYTFQIVDVFVCDECGSRMTLREGKYGKFLSCNNTKCKCTRSVEKYYKNRQ